MATYPTKKSFPHYKRDKPSWIRLLLYCKKRGRNKSSRRQTGKIKKASVAAGICSHNSQAILDNFGFAYNPNKSDARNGSGDQAAGDGDDRGADHRVNKGIGKEG
jgi:hypothetical protein